MNIGEGLFCDVHPIAQPHGTMRDSYDGYISTGRNGGVWVPVDGTQELPIVVDGSAGVPFTSRMLKIVQVGISTVWIVITADHKVVFYLRVIGSNSVNLTKVVEFTATEFFDITDPLPDYNTLAILDCFGMSDGNGKDYVYLTTGKNQPLCVPIRANVSVTISQCRYVPDLLGFRMTATEITGSLPCGCNTFCAQLFNEDGTTSQWTSFTPWIAIASTPWMKPTGNDLGIQGSYDDKTLSSSINGLSGGGISDRSTSGIKLNITSNFGIGYERIRIACFNRGKNGASTLGYICYENLYTSEICYTVKNYIRSILVSDVIVQSTEIHNVKNMSFYKDVQVVSSFNELDGILDEDRYKISSGSLVSKPTITTIERKVPRLFNGTVQGTWVTIPPSKVAEFAFEMVTPRIFDLKDPVFAPNEIYELAAIPITYSGTKGNAIKLGQVRIDDYCVNDSIRMISNETPLVTDSARSISYPVRDIKVTNLDLSVFRHPSVERVELLYRNVSNAILGYGMVRTPVVCNDANAGGMLPQSGAQNVCNSNLILHIPEHLFGMYESYEFKDLEIELFECYTYNDSGMAMKSFIATKFSGNDNITYRVNNIPFRSKYTIQNAMELNYSNENNVIFDGLPGARRNSTTIDASRAWGYGGRSLLLKLDTPYPKTAAAWWGYCRVVRKLPSISNENLFRSSGISIDMKNCTITDTVQLGHPTKKYLAPEVVLKLGDHYARNFSLITVMPLEFDVSRTIRETGHFPVYSKIDIAYRVGSHLATDGIYADGNRQGIGIDYTRGYAKLENFSIHDHYVDALPPFVWSSIEEKLRTSMHQHIRWTVKRMTNSRFDELRRFLPNDIVAADLTSGSITSTLFLADMLMIVQERAVGRMPYNERVAIGNKSEIFLGTGKEFGNYYRIINDGCLSKNAIAVMGNDLIVSLYNNGIIAAVNGSTNVDTEIPKIDLLRNLGVSSHELLDSIHNELICTPIIGKLCYLTLGNTTVIISVNSNSAKCVGLTSALPSIIELVDGKLYGLTYNEGISKMYVHKKGSSTIYNRQIVPKLSVILKDSQGSIIQPVSVHIPGLTCPPKDIILEAEEVATGGYDGHDAMEQSNHRYTNDGWKLSMPFAVVRGSYKKLNGSYLTLTLTFPSDSQKLATFGYINELIVNSVVKR